MLLVNSQGLTVIELWNCVSWFVFKYLSSGDDPKGLSRRPAVIQVTKEVICAAICSCSCPWNIHIALRSHTFAEEFVLRTSSLCRFYELFTQALWSSPKLQTFASPQCAWLAETVMINRLQTANNE